MSCLRCILRPFLRISGGASGEASGRHSAASRLADSMRFPSWISTRRSITRNREADADDPDRRGELPQHGRPAARSPTRGTRNAVLRAVSESSPSRPAARMNRSLRCDRGGAASLAAPLISTSLYIMQIIGVQRPAGHPGARALHGPSTPECDPPLHPLAELTR